MLAAALTFMPAIAAVSGRRLFWPSRAWEREDDGGRIARLADAVARRPARAALAVTAVLALLGTAALGTRSDHDLGGGGPATEATRTEDRIAAALPRGATDPQDVHVRSDRPLSAAALAPLRARLARVDGVGAVAAPQLSADRRVARLDVALDAPSATARAMDVARGPLRDAARAGAPAQSTALVGGSAAVLADVSDAVARDLRLVFPVAAALILLVLVATLRSVVAPLVLLAAVALEFAAALGASVLAVQLIGGAPGVAFTLPLVLFLFVVAIGTDYNLLVAARLREEARAGATPREAARAAVRRVGPAVTAAGLVLAASFGTLVLAADSATRQTGFALATGILIASLAVSVVLVPALAALLGPRLWWPVRSRRPRPRPARNAPVTPAPVRR
jgi:RND superfamily putative drug exporter